MKKLSEFERDLKMEVLRQFGIFLLVFMLGFCALMTWFLIKLANAITRPVIELYELIKHIVE